MCVTVKLITQRKTLDISMVSSIFLGEDRLDGYESGDRSSCVWRIYLSKVSAKKSLSDISSASQIRSMVSRLN